MTQSQTSSTKTYWPADCSPACIPLFRSIQALWIEFLFTGKERYAGLKGFREIVEVLGKNDVHIGYITEREIRCLLMFTAFGHQACFEQDQLEESAKDSFLPAGFPTAGHDQRRAGKPTKHVKPKKNASIWLKNHQTNQSARWQVIAQQAVVCK